jgi:hypothetical protein
VTPEATAVPLRDHFHPPLENRRHWEGFHGQWPGVIVQYLSDKLPPQYFAEPRVHAGSRVEIDVAGFHEEDGSTTLARGNGNGVATAVWSPPRPTRTCPIAFADQDLYEVQVYDERHGCRPVAAVELVSPANKDRPEHRRAFAVKCASYLQEGVSLIVVDVVTERTHCLYAEMAPLLSLDDSFLMPEPPPLYAVVCRTSRHGEAWQMETWSERLAVGSPLPTLPLWLAKELAVPLALEETYEETCRVLRIP